METVSIADVAGGLDAAAHAAGGVPVVLDVRTPEEFAHAHVPGSLFIPMAVLPVRLGELDRATTYHVICESGGRSHQVTAWLEQQGFDARNVIGGMSVWRASGLPIETGLPVTG